MAYCFPLKGTGLLVLATTAGETMRRFATRAVLTIPLANFRPKGSSDYIAHVEGRELIERRSHEALIADFGGRASSARTAH